VIVIHFHTTPVLSLADFYVIGYSHGGPKVQ